MDILDWYRHPLATLRAALGSGALRLITTLCLPGHDDSQAFAPIPQVLDANPKVFEADSRAFDVVSTLKNDDLQARGAVPQRAGAKTQSKGTDSRAKGHLARRKGARTRAKGTDFRRKKALRRRFGDRPERFVSVVNKVQQ
jgi:hypothetical protein